MEILSIMVLLYINRIELVCSDEDIIDSGLEVKSGKYGTEYVMECIITLVINIDKFNWWILKATLRLHH